MREYYIRLEESIYSVKRMPNEQECKQISDLFADSLEYMTVCEVISGLDQAREKILKGFLGSGQQQIEFALHRIQKLVKQHPDIDQDF